MLIVRFMQHRHLRVIMCVTTVYCAHCVPKSCSLNWRKHCKDYNQQSTSIYVLWQHEMKITPKPAGGSSLYSSFKKRNQRNTDIQTTNNQHLLNILNRNHVYELVLTFINHTSNSSCHMSCVHDHEVHKTVNLKYTYLVQQPARILFRNLSSRRI